MSSQDSHFGYKSIITGLAALVFIASCSTTKLTSDRSMTKDMRNKNSIVCIDTTIEDKFDNVRQDIFREFSTDSIISRLTKDISIYNNRPKINTLPEGVKVVGSDTLDFRYTPAGPIDPARLSRNNEVSKNALRIFPKSRPFLKYIFDACDKYRPLFDVPPELMIAILYCESGADQYAISYAGARGGWQFMEPTAEGMGMNVGSLSVFPKFYALEKKVVALARSHGYYYVATKKSLAMNNFELVKRYKLTADSLLKEYNSARAALITEAQRIGPKNIAKVDQTMDIPVSTENAVELMAGLAKRFKKEFHCNNEQALLWAQEAYNAGYNTVKYGMKAFPETKDYTRQIAFMRAKFYPITN